MILLEVINLLIQIFSATDEVPVLVSLIQQRLII